MSYDQIYKHKNVWGDKPNPLLRKVFSQLEPGSEFLDLGCGQGRDALFMLQNGFKVTAIDNSREGIKKILEAMAKNNLPAKKMTLLCQDIANFKIEENKYATINSYNVLHFLTKKDAVWIIGEIKQAVKSGGHVIIACSFIQKPLAENNQHCYVGAGELGKAFSDFKIILYEERVTEDKGHAGSPEPHQHNVVKMIARKK
jgi:tellurite methyltransferase